MVGPQGNLARVTIGVFNYNQASYVESCLAGVRRQTYPNLQVVLVDDGSGDGSDEFLAEAVPTIPHDTMIIRDGRNVGLATRMNQVLDAAQGEWVIWCAADDVLAPSAVEALMTAVDGTADVIFGDLRKVDQTGTYLGFDWPGGTWLGQVARRYSKPSNPAHDMSRFSNFVPGGLSLIRRSALTSVGGYPSDIRLEDFNMWLELSPSSRFRYIPVVVGDYRVVEVSHSHSEAAALRAHGLMVARQRSRGRVPRPYLARMLAQRWAFGVVRNRGQAAVSLRQLAHLGGIPIAQVLTQLPAALLHPLILMIRWRLIGAEQPGRTSDVSDVPLAG